jgi:hypothetical protein
VIPVVGTVRPMDDTEQEAPDQAASDTQTDDSTDGGSPAQTVRVPNVSANAKSGLDHTIIGSNALAAADDDQGDDAETTAPSDDAPADMPTGDQDAALAWIAEAQDSDTAKERADAVWKAYAQPGDGDDSDLAKALRSTVYGNADPAPTPPADPAPGEVTTTAAAPASDQGSDPGTETPAPVNTDDAPKPDEGQTSGTDTPPAG